MLARADPGWLPQTPSSFSLLCRKPSAPSALLLLLAAAPGNWTSLAQSIASPATTFSVKWMRRAKPLWYVDASCAAPPPALGIYAYPLPGGRFLCGP